MVTDVQDCITKLIAALDTGPKLARALHPCPPGWQRSYVTAPASAKTEATHLTRIARF